MKYLLVSLINAIYGVLLLVTLKQDTPGFILIIFIATVLTILGLLGFILWARETIRKEVQTSIALKNWFQIAKGVDILLILGLLFRSFVLQPFLVEGNSMELNYHDREFILVDRISYRFVKPRRGEVIIFRYPKNPSQDYIKRIIGLPDETVEIKNGRIYVNSLLLNEDYLPEGTLTYNSNGSTNTLERKLGQDEYFVLGDNRNGSSDSREWGTVPAKNLIGRAWFVIYPLDNFGKIKNPPYPPGSFQSLLFPSNLLAFWSLTCSKFS